VKGDRPRRAAEQNKQTKKKTMKTNKQNQNQNANRKQSTKSQTTVSQDIKANDVKGLESRSDNVLGTEPSQQSEREGSENGQTLNSQPSTLNTTRQGDSVRPYVNFAERAFNRTLPTDKVLAALKRWTPRAYELAKVVGKWVWIQFPEQPEERLRADLSQLGFHWNNTRKCWQHPCGETLPRGSQEPTAKYETYFPADRVAI
jgi:hypothetical protein